MKLVLVRHGYSKGNQEGTYSGWTDVPLIEEGINELKEIRETYNFPKTERYIASDLVRCQDTFKYLFAPGETLYESSEQLREIYFGDYENLPGNAMTPHFFEGFPLNERTAKGETISEFTYRVINKLSRALTSAKQDGLDSLTVVCHSGVIKAILIFLEHRPFKDFRSIDTPNGLGYVLDIDVDVETGLLKLNHVEPIAKK